MFRCDENFSKPKRYIQYNDLVFLGRKSIDEQSESISLRESKTSRTFTHGSYVGNQSEKSLIDDNSISLKVALRTQDWSEEHVQAHYDFIIEQLTTPGKLWAIQTGLQLVWCNAYVTSIQSAKEWVITDDDYLVFKVELDNPDGVWYKADEAKTYLEPYDNCDFTQTNVQFMNDFYEECNSKWRIVYNCSRCKQDGKQLKDLYKHAICDTCVNEVMTGEFLSTTVLDSHRWSFALEGDFKDPIVRINERDFKILGTYSGVLTADYKGKVKHARSWECLEFSYNEVPLDALRLCAEMPYVKKGLNTVSVSGVTSESACIYLDYESVTI